MFRILFFLALSLFLVSCGDGLTYEQKINRYNHYISKADSLIQIQEYTEAVKYANSAIELADTLSLGYIRKGYCGYELNWMDIAEENFDKAIKIEGKQSKVYKLRALVHLKNKDSDFLDDINVYIENYPDDEDALKLRRDYYEEKNDLDKAIEEYNVAININSDSTELILKRSELYFKNGDWDKALVDYESILKLEPDNNFVIDKKNELNKLMADKGKRNEFIFLLCGIYVAYLMISFFILRPIITKKAHKQVGGEFKLKLDPLIWLLPILLLVVFVIFNYMDIIPTF